MCISPLLTVSTISLLISTPRTLVLLDAINADVSALNIGDNLRVSDLNIEGCNILLNDSVLLFACKRTRAAMSLDSETEGAEEGAEDSSQSDESGNTDN